VLAGVLVGWQCHLFVGGDETHDERLTAPAGGLGTHVVGQLSRGHVNEPASRAVGHPGARPLLRGGEQSLLHRVFRGKEIAELPAHDAQHLRRQVAQQALDVGVRRIPSVQSPSLGGPLITSRTSIPMLSGVPPGPGAADASAAIAYARAGPSTSTIQ